MSAENQIQYFTITLFLTDTYEEARHKLLQAEDESDLQTEAEPEDGTQPSSKPVYMYFFFFLLSHGLETRCIHP